jgi:hypothetical protein
MPPTSAKNQSLLVTDLGLGDMLGQQAQDETDEERKRRLAQQRQNALNPAITGLLGGPRDTLGGYGGFGR